MAKVLGLNVPELHKADKDSFDLRPKAVAQWLDDLPRANIGETARQVFEALVESNRFQYPYQDRIQFLEAIRETVIYVTDAMQRHFVGVSAPLPDKSLKIAAATREIHHSLALGYMVAIEDMLKRSLLFSDNAMLIKLMHRAMSTLGKVLLTCYQTYIPYSRQLWSELHKLYAAAEQRKLLNTPVYDPHLNYVQKTTLNQEYSRLLLLALTSPYRLRHGEVGKVYAILERWTAKCHLTTMEQDNSENPAKFGVNLASDDPPRSVAMATENCAHAYCRILNSEPLAHAVRKELKRGLNAGEITLTGIEMQRPDLSQDLLKRLLIAWCVISKRHFARTEVQEQVHVTLGLTATHQIIISGTRKRAAQEDSFSHAAHFESSNVDHSLHDVQPDVWDMIYYPSDIEGFETLENEYNQQQTNRTVKPKMEPDSWSILNESARGYCLHKLPNEHASRAQVGELVGIRRQQNGHTWKWGIGVIRWLKNAEDNTLMLGIEMLTPDAAAIGIRSLENAKHDYSRTLMLPEIRAINQPTTLILGPVPYRVGNKLIINILGKEILILLKKMTQNTGLFAQFTFDILEQQPPATDDHNDANDETDFSGVWHSI